MSSYSIRRGDTLSSIASRNHTTVAKLASLNHLHNPNLIRAGQRLQLPGGSDHFQPAAKHTTHAAHTTHTSHASHTTTQATGAAGGNGSKEARLAAAGRRVAMGMGGYTSHGLCATGVSRAISSALGISVHGNGNQIDNNLPRGKFRQVNMSLAQALRTPGLVLTWEHTSTRLGRIYGHTAITTGDGHTSCSDFIERNTLAGAAHRTGLKIFMPI
jgi:murein DD-endopeptidase MepM/ murein hydrolase activator NlpD